VLVVPKCDTDTGGKFPIVMVCGGGNGKASPNFTYRRELIAVRTNTTALYVGLRTSYVLPIDAGYRRRTQQKPASKSTACMQMIAIACRLLIIHPLAPLLDII